MFNPYILAAAGFGLVGAFATGFQMRGQFESGKQAETLLEQATISTQIIDRKDGEIAQCRAQVEKINATVAEQGRKLSNMLSADQRAREKAAREAIARDQERQARLEAVSSNLIELKGMLDDGKFGDCAGDGVPDEFVSLLNDAIATGSDSEGGSSDMPPDRDKN